MIDAGTGKSAQGGGSAAGKNNNTTKKSAASASASATPAAKATTTLQRVDYLEYIEQTGKDVINMLINNKAKVNGLTSTLRKRMSEKVHSSFGNLDNDSWRIVNYVNP